MDVGRRVTDPIADSALSQNFSPIETRTVHAVCLFVGYPRSGHSLVGAILDSHPRAVIAHELDLVACWEQGVTWPELASLIVANSSRTARNGRRQSGYSYALSGQGESSGPKVLGDKKGGRTAQYLLQAPDILSRFQADTPWPISLIHVVRDPRDNVATMARLHGLSPEKALNSYRRRAEAVAALQQTWPSDRFLNFYLEDLVGRPDSQLARLFNFLNLELTESHRRAIRKLIFDTPRTTRDQIDWGSTQHDLEATCRSLPHLRRYLT